MAVAEKNKEFERLRSQLYPYKADHPTLKGKSIAIEALIPWGHSEKLRHANRLLLSQFLFYTLGAWVIGHPTKIEEICETPAESPFAHHLARGRVFNFTREGIFDLLPKPLRPPPEHEFWGNYYDSLLVSVVMLNNPREEHLCRKLGADGRTITYFFRQKRRKTLSRE